MTQTLTKQIKRYSVAYYGGGKRSTAPYDYRAIIGLYDDAGLIAGLYFHAEARTIPPSDHLPTSGQPMSHFPIEDFPRVLDLLRNEAPVYYEQFSGWPMASLSTSLEPIGEGEPTAR